MGSTDEVPLGSLGNSVVEITSVRVIDYNYNYLGLQCISNQLELQLLDGKNNQL